MTPDKVCIIFVACRVFHNKAIIWKQPMLEVSRTIIEHGVVKELSAISESSGNRATIMITVIYVFPDAI